MGKQKIGRIVEDEPMVSISVRVPESLAALFQQQAMRDDRTVSGAIRYVMRRYVAAGTGKHV